MWRCGLVDGEQGFERGGGAAVHAATLHGGQSVEWGGDGVAG